MLKHSPVKIAIQTLFLLILSSVLIFGGTITAQEGDTAVHATETHKAMIQQVYDEVMTAGNLDLMTGIYAPDYINHGYGSDLSLEDFKTIITAMRDALPDFKAAVEVLIAEDDMAASRVVFSGTFENDWVLADQTIKPNGKAVQWSLNILHRFNEDDLIAEDFTAFDMLGLLTQLDAAPLPKFIADLLISSEYTPAVMETPTNEINDQVDLDKAAFTHVIMDGINNSDYTAMDTYMADDHQAHEPFGDFGREQFKQVISAFRATIPDLNVTIDDLVAEGDWLAARLTYAGTFTSDLSVGLITVKATDKPIKFIVNVFVHYNKDGISIEDFKEYNRLSWLRQAELIPPAPVAP